MKFFSSILILLLLILTNPDIACSKVNDGIYKTSRLLWKDDPGLQTNSQSVGFLDEQDSNDIDGLNYFIINQLLSVNMFQYKGKTIPVVEPPFNFQDNFNNLLIDLPPPFLS